MSAWVIEAEPVDDAGIDALIREFTAEVGRRLLGRPATGAELRAVLDRDPHGDLAPPRGTFLVARDDDGDLIGCVGARLLDDLPATAELKRMYVRPAHRGAGVGRALLVAAEQAAAALGATRIVLDTRTVLVEARTLYSSHGYRETAPYNDHGDAEHWYAKTLR
ncbi:GNAT family N-acetyltransferase [Saccharopolyspora gloriosae]|uniref:GNAT superfamily N-acetyltransferase n=1 Tax=Saccharopolyspora gloriosae TaxID=455344 RepID=A0A840NL42_9PSEU|nr:GNAT family N-acetyltransferase [Saccharopolyspora gloriosae]MBB5071038.1 GNAT superfamily N-acetyltransferase [Saccharopolyspora gloriosae]